MKTHSSRKTTIIAVVVILIAIIAYFYYNGSSSSTGALLLVSQEGGQSIGSSELALLNQIQSLKIDTSLFQSPVYKSLLDHTVPIPTEQVGRPNPFVPYPGDTTVMTGSGAGAPAAH